MLSASSANFAQAALRSAHNLACAGLRQCNVEMDMDLDMDIRFGNCLPNWLIANQSTTTSPYGFDAMLCPGLTFWRPNSTHLIIGDVSLSLIAAARVFAQFPISTSQVASH